MTTDERIAYWTKELTLEAHPEGGWFSEVYACPEEYGRSQDGRVLGGSIYFLLGRNDISHFHVIDCEEIWYVHEGCGVELWLLYDDADAECSAAQKDSAPEEMPDNGGGMSEGGKTPSIASERKPSARVEKRLLGCGEGMSPMVAIPKGVIFGARNIDPESYTLMSCATMPNFHYEGFRMVPQKELLQVFPEQETLIREMAFDL